jgi:dihydropteroate synthase
MEFLKVEDNNFLREIQLTINGKLFTFDHPIVMGIVNCTPDSFYIESQNDVVEAQIKTIDKHLQEGADWIDIGGYSSRPGAIDISENEEIERILPAIQYLAKNHPNCIISIDTFRANVAQKAIEAGAHIVNDITGGNGDKNMFSIVGKLKCPYILMHMKGTPRTMQTENNYSDLIKDIVLFFSEQIALAQAAGIVDIIIDPGFGFAKDTAQNFELFHSLPYFHLFRRPILVGISRKSMIYKTLETTPENALNGSTVLNTLALQNGAAILRVHDVREAKEVVVLSKLATKHY